MRKVGQIDGPIRKIGSEDKGVMSEGLLLSFTSHHFHQKLKSHSEVLPIEEKTILIVSY